MKNLIHIYKDNIEKDGHFWWAVRGSRNLGEWRLGANIHVFQRCVSFSIGVLWWNVSFGCALKRNKIEL